MRIQPMLDAICPYGQFVDAFEVGQGRELTHLETLWRLHDGSYKRVKIAIGTIEARLVRGRMRRK